MIQNNLCETCEHGLVCGKLKTLKKFDNNEKTYIGVDIEMLECRDFMEFEDDN